MEILIKSKFITGPQCGEIVGELKRVKHIEPKARMSELRTEIPARSLREHGCELLDSVRARVLGAARDFFRDDGLRLEFTLVSEMHPGDCHPLHADNERRSDGQWVPNHTPYRSHAAILYLNSGGQDGDYSGGMLRFPERRFEVVPRAGTLVAFPCGRAFEHEVGVIADGSRYTFALWMTRHSEREERWP
jgi:predicted 2-oxoglutarate/Fe(II)-dependent dioxygenase YbiX